PSLHALDFLQLASGASFAELEERLDPLRSPGRIECLKEIKRKGLLDAPIFPLSDDRSFLEILYVKLSFLSNILQRVLTQNPTASTFRIESTWVRIPPVSNTLSPFSNFSIEIIENVTPEPSIIESFTGAAADRFGSMGVFWFQTLIQNRS